MKRLLILWLIMAAVLYFVLAVHLGNVAGYAYALLMYALGLIGGYVSHRR